VTRNARPCNDKKTYVTRSYYFRPKRWGLEVNNIIIFRMEKSIRMQPERRCLTTTVQVCSPVRIVRFLLLAVVVRLARYYIIIIHRVTYYTHPPNTTHTFHCPKLYLSEVSRPVRVPSSFFIFPPGSTDVIRTAVYQLLLKWLG